MQSMGYAEEMNLAFLNGQAAAGAEPCVALQPLFSPGLMDPGQMERVLDKFGAKGAKGREPAAAAPEPGLIDLGKLKGKGKQ